MVRNDYFTGRKLLIATKHRKEKVIAPILEEKLGVKCFVPDNLDTDRFGTFSGEIDREDDPLTTAQKKCKYAMKHYHMDLALASEGSFGSHPSLFFVPADDEILYLIDTKNNLELVARELSTDTNFRGAEIFDEDQLKEFARIISFPSHAVIMRKSKGSPVGIIKGINNWESLYQNFKNFKKEIDSVFIETDMRAMYNPTRMSVIEKATNKLVRIIQSECPACGIPGFWISDAIPGLPCMRCGKPTRSILSYLYKCQICQFSKEDKYPGNKKKEDPMFCDFCNP